MTFEDLDAWKKSRKLVSEIYTLTRVPGLSKDYGLCNQVQRAAVSVMSNIAEGFERAHGQEKLQAYNVARASCGEVRSLLYVIEDNYPPTSSVLANIRGLIEDAGSLVSGLLASTRRRQATKIAGIATLLLLLGWSGIWLIS